jgi:hypothetical protein
MEEILCFKMFSGLTLIAHATPITSDKYKDEPIPDEIIGYNLRKIRVLNVFQIDPAVAQAQIQLSPYFIGNRNDLDVKPVRLMEHQYHHKPYQATLDIENFYRQLVSGIVIPDSNIRPQH